MPRRGWDRSRRPSSRDTRVFPVPATPVESDETQSRAIRSVAGSNRTKLNPERFDPLPVSITGGDNWFDKALLHFQSECDVWMKIAERADSRHYHAVFLKNVHLMISPYRFRYFSTRCEDRSSSGVVAYPERYIFRSVFIGVDLRLRNTSFGP